MALLICDLKNLRWTVCYVSEWPAQVKKCFLMYSTELWNHVFMIIVLCSVPDTTEESFTPFSLWVPSQGCRSSPLLTRLSKPAPQPILAWCSKPWTSCASFTPLSKFLISFLKWGIQNRTAHYPSFIMYIWEYLSWYFMRIKLLYIFQSWQFKVRDYKHFYLCPMASISSWRELH